MRPWRVLEGFAATQGIPFLEAARRVDEIGELAARAKGAVTGFVQVMDRLQEAFDSGAGPQRMVEAAATESGYLMELEAERTVEAEGRIENLRELGGVAAEFEQRAPEGALDEFLEQVSLVGDQDEYDEDAGVGHADDAARRQGPRVPGGVHHRPRGRVFPHYRSMGDQAELEEERRLVYVGVTRAQQRLYLTHAWSRTLFGSTSYNPASRFLGEIPTDLLRSLEDEGSVIGGSGGSGGPSAIRAAVEGRRAIPDISAGDTVLHDKWGEGVVLTIDGAGTDAEATVRFEDAGEKRLLLAYAPLSRVVVAPR